MKDILWGGQRGPRLGVTLAGQDSWGKAITAPLGSGKEAAQVGLLGSVLTDLPIAVWIKPLDCYNSACLIGSDYEPVYVTVRQGVGTFSMSLLLMASVFIYYDWKTS